MSWERCMPVIHDLAGERFTRLVALRRVADRRSHRTVWLCRCDCGAETVVRTGDLRSGNTRSCGCFYRETCSRTARQYLGKGNRQHGLYGTGEHRVWATMKSRCLNPNAQRYADYGGRGIKVCDRWLKVENFYADMGPRPAGVSPGGRALYSIHRIDNDGDYEPGNCCWATQQEQQVRSTSERRAAALRGMSRRNVS